MINAQIVDISRWQGTIPLSTLKAWKAAGVERVVIKAGGADSGIYKDASHDANVANARAAGLGVDHYFFNGPGDAATIARSFVGYANPQPGDRMWLDIENEGKLVHWDPPTALTIANFVKADCGILPGFYMSSSVTSAQNWSAAVAAGVGLWVAQYGSNNGNAQGSPKIAYWSSYVYWQYTSVGHEPGYGGNLDLSTTGGAAVITVASGPDYSTINRTNRSTKDLQHAINALGYTPALIEDGIPGPLTAAGIVFVEKRFGLSVDSGIAGPQVQAKLWPASAPVPAPRPAAPSAPAFPLPAGSYFGPKSGPAQSVSGYFSHNADLKAWQQQMKNRGNVITVDGLYGDQTANLAYNFQGQCGLTRDKLIGPATWAAAWTAPITGQKL